MSTETTSASRTRSEDSTEWSEREKRAEASIPFDLFSRPEGKPFQPVEEDSISAKDILKILEKVVEANTASQKETRELLARLNIVEEEEKSVKKEVPIAEKPKYSDIIAEYPGINQDLEVIEYGHNYAIVAKRTRQIIERTRNPNGFNPVVYKNEENLVVLTILHWEEGPEHSPYLERIGTPVLYLTRTDDIHAILRMIGECPIENERLSDFYNGLY